MKKVIALMLILVVSFLLVSTAVSYAGDTSECQLEKAAKSASVEKVWWNPLSWFKSDKTACELK